jgi:hypothetical protein
MNEYAPDLVELLAQARSQVRDDRQIWCTASDTFESRLLSRRGILLGGAYSPHFLRDSSPTNWELPWTVRLRNCRITVCDGAASQPVSAWLPLLEAIAGAREGLLVVTEDIERELLTTFVVNAVKGTLPVCVVRPAAGASSGARLAVPPKTPDQLIRIDEVWVRRSATVLLPKADDPLANSPTLENVVVLEVGGENHEDQHHRLRLLMHELQTTSRR